MALPCLRKPPSEPRARLHRMNRYANTVSTVALVVALTGTAAVAKHGGLIGTRDIRKNAVTPAKVKFPRPQRVSGPARARVAAYGMTGDFQPLEEIGTYVKVAGTDLQVTWSGTARSLAYAGGCIFQLRVKGQPPAGGGGEAYVNQGTESVSVQGIFPGLPEGEYPVEIWARVEHPYDPARDSCELGGAGIAQTVNALEVVR